MKQSRQIVLSLLLAASLLTAPIAIAQPQAPAAPGFDVAAYLNGLVDDIVSIFAPASPVINPNGQPADDDDGDGEDGGDAPVTFDSGKIDPPTSDASPVINPYG
ncbi:MAG: hypothetical protein AAFY88_04430 [Acidobacteriota bacterium]